MPQYWCLNFDGPDLRMLAHGLNNQLWMMQYQYAHSGQANQQHKLNRITRNWRVAQKSPSVIGAWHTCNRISFTQWAK